MEKKLKFNGIIHSTPKQDINGFRISFFDDWIYAKGKCI